MPRYCPPRNFPPYAYLPGHAPHPRRDPRGYAYGHEEPAASYLPATRWQENDAYLWGADLYNHGFVWEAHEAWERAWRAAQDAQQRAFLQGLILATAACVKCALHNQRGAERLGHRALERLEQVQANANGSFMGLELTRFVAAWQRFLQTRPMQLEQRPRLTLEPPEG